MSDDPKQALEPMSPHRKDAGAAACPACGQILRPYFTRVHDAVSQQEFAIVKCGGCGLGITEPQPCKLDSYYAEYHRGRHGATASYCAWRRLRWVAQIMGRGRGRRLLDVGCGDGTFLARAVQAGWQGVGTEYNPEPAREMGLDVRDSLYDCAAGERFDCITMWHTLEHMANAHDVLGRIRMLLNEDGMLVVAVPNNGGWQARLFGPHWFHLDVPRHLLHFDRRSLLTMLGTARFTPVQQWQLEFEYDLMGWVQSALNTLLPTPNAFFDLVRGRNTRARYWESAASWGGGLALSCLMSPLVAASTLARGAGTLIVAARPTPPSYASFASTNRPSPITTS